MVRVALLALLLVGCGGTLQPGLYKVSIKYVKDTWPGATVPRTTKADWRITEKDGTYTLQVRDTPYEYTGKEEGTSVYFQAKKHAKDPDCFATSLELRVRQEEDNRISGNGEVLVVFDCNGVVFETQVTIAGYLVEEL